MAGPAMVDRLGQITEVAQSGTVTVSSSTPWFVTGRFQAEFPPAAPTEANFFALQCPALRRCP